MANQAKINNYHWFPQGVIFKQIIIKINYFWMHYKFFLIDVNLEIKKQCFFLILLLLITCIRGVKTFKSLRITLRIKSMNLVFLWFTFFSSYPDH